MPSQRFVPALNLTQYTGSNSEEILALFDVTFSGDGSRTFQPAAVVEDGGLFISWPGNEAWTGTISISVGDWVSRNGLQVISDTDLNNGYVPLGNVENSGTP